MSDERQVIDRKATDLQVDELYRLMKLRLAVFGSEQGINWIDDFDDRDLEPQTHHIWTGRQTSIESYLRITTDGPDQWKLGRVCTRAESRGKGLASALKQFAIDNYGDRAIRITAEAHLENWYRSFGFEPTGAGFELAGISHVEMIRHPN